MEDLQDTPHKVMCCLPRAHSWNKFLELGLGGFTVLPRAASSLLTSQQTSFPEEASPPVHLRNMITSEATPTCCFCLVGTRLQA
ncbi:hypothetical protein H920_15071 [Fukomys damarensis]|uniref:Uncharacterized protein n=1 Tax=Fukomys damarensis TaxID=885580 RepID=A0A091CV71_FUKDA|nr:hypothetical protein H920_15071 [Fukomys damarensis]